MGPGALHMVDVMREHKNCKVPEGSYVCDLPSPRLSHRVVTGIVLRSHMELLSTAVLSPA